MLPRRVDDSGHVAVTRARRPRAGPPATPAPECSTPPRPRVAGYAATRACASASSSTERRRSDVASDECATMTSSASALRANSAT